MANRRDGEVDGPVISEEIKVCSFFWKAREGFLHELQPTVDPGDVFA